MRVYLDNAATTAMREEVIEAMLPFMREHYGNPSSIHAEGRKVRAAIESARKTVAESIGASIGEIFFTSGGTESNNMALKCAVRDLGVKRIISAPTEHHCVLHTLESVEKKNGIEILFLDVDDKGRLSFEQLEELLKQGNVPTLVSLMHANNEIGTMLDLEALSELCQSNNAYLHSDTVQTVGHFPINVNTVQISFLSGAAHKFHGPKGVGFIYINNDNMIQPYIDGGAQERNMRGGTENVYGIIGMAKALAISYSDLEQDSRKVRELRDDLKSQLLNAFDDIEFNGDLDGSALYTVLSVSFPPGPKADLMLLSLDIEGISASGGSACSSGAETGSHVLKAIGANPDRKTIRFSFSPFNTKEEIDYVVEKLKALMPERSTVEG